MGILNQWFESRGELIVTQPLSVPVPAHDQYAQTEGLAHLGQRLLRRQLYLWLNGQLSLMQNKASPNWRRGLWIYERTSQIGDALMDLAARSLLTECGIKIDLLCNDKLADVFDKDAWFDKIFIDPHEAKQQSYDFVIAQSVHHRSLRKKVKYFKSLPWLCMQGYYDVPDFARAPFGAQRLADLWGVTPANLAFHGKQKLAHTQRASKVATSDQQLTLVLGGMDIVRTYLRWDEVIEKISLSGNWTINLVGTGDTALAQSHAIMARTHHVPLNNYVNQTSITDIKSILLRTDLLVCADGGLMHMGVAYDVPKIVGLFIKGIPGVYRLPHIHEVHSITSSTGLIADIAVEALVENIQTLLAH
jgi:heptosyltransferase-2